MGTDSFPPHLTVRSSLQCRICLRSYRIFYVSQTEDLIFRRKNVAAESPRNERKNRFATWLEARTAKLEEVGKEEVTKEAVVPTVVEEGEDVKMDVEA